MQLASVPKLLTCSVDASEAHCRPTPRPGVHKTAIAVGNVDPV